LIREDNGSTLNSNAAVKGGVEGKLPLELEEMVKKYFSEDPDGSLMGKEEANDHRLKLMEERGRFVRKSEEGWQANSYTFCEH